MTIALVGGPYDGRSIVVVLGDPHRVFQVPERVVRDGQVIFVLHSYRLAVRRDRRLVYRFEGAAESELR